MTVTKIIHIPIPPRRRPTIARALAELTHLLPCKRWPRDTPIPSRVHKRLRLLRTVIIHPVIMLLNVNDARIARVPMKRHPLGYHRPPNRCQLRTPLRHTLARPPAPGGQITFTITSGWGLLQISATMGRPNASTTESSAIESATKTGSVKEGRGHESGNANVKEVKSPSVVALLPTRALAPRATLSTIATATCPIPVSLEGTTTTTSHAQLRRARCPHDHALSLRHGVARVMRITNERSQT
jgi:hypothetical protein